MSATNREQEAEVLTLDTDSKASKARFEAQVLELVNEVGIPEDDVRKLVAALRKSRKKTKRAKGDFYETPAWVVDAILPYLPLEGEPIVVDAGSGTGAIAARLSQVCPKAEIVGIEKQPELVEKARARGLFNVEFREGNFLNDSLDTLKSPDLVIANPPFGMAMHFVQRALQVVRRGGTVCMLLRLGWLASKTRREFNRKHPSDPHVLTKRPSFTGNGRTDASDYAWFIWSPQAKGQVVILTHDDKKRRPSLARRNHTPAAA